ncbi:MAG: rRNA pseudouridine synthase [Saprospiraceae bacterium]|nr:rRNA pseudouridine synthase [Saprospiraceae bacterium]
MDSEEEVLRLNKYLAHCGVATRKQAADIIKKGEVSVNDVVELNPFYVLKKEDKVTYKGKVLQKQIKNIYLLLNKPKNCDLWPSEDRHKLSVMDLIKKNTNLPLMPAFPVADSTCGLIVLTNDTELIQKLTHSGKSVKNVFEIVLDKPITQEDLKAFNSAGGLGDSTIKITGANYVNDGDHTCIGMEVWKGTDDDIVKILNSMGYHVKKIDRSFFGGLTKKDLKRGWSRHLTEKEVIFLKYFN